MSPATKTKGARRSLRGAFSAAFRVSATLAALGASCLLLWVLGTVTWRGLLALSPSRLSTVDVSQGASGLGDALVGSLIVVGLSFVMAVPVGVLVGSFIAEMGRNSRLLPAVRFAVDTLRGVPAIVAGVFVYFLMTDLGSGQGLLAGSLALAVLMMPMLACHTARALEAVPPSLREAAAALGTPPWRILIQISMRAAAPGIVSAGLLVAARVAGQVAPLLVTMPARTDAAPAPGAVMPTLHVEAYRLLLTADLQAPSLAWTAALMLTVATASIVWLAGLVDRERR